MPVDPVIRKVRREADRLRGVAQVYAVPALMWLALATLQWFTDARSWLQIGWTVPAVLNVVAAVLHRRKAQEAVARLQALRAETSP